MKVPAWRSWCTGRRLTVSFWMGPEAVQVNYLTWPWELLFLEDQPAIEPPLDGQGNRKPHGHALVECQPDSQRGFRPNEFGQKPVDAIRNQIQLEPLIAKGVPDDKPP